MFTIYSDSSTDSTMVSNLFIDEYMKSANDAQIKIYLYLLRMMGVHRPTSISDMADHFNHTEKDVVRSLRYWEQKGLLDLTFGKENDLVSICLRRLAPSAGSAAPKNNTLPDSRVLHFLAPAEASLAGNAEDPSCLRMAAGGTPVQMPPQITEAAPLSAPAVPSVPAKGSSSELEALERFRKDTGRAQLLFVIEQYIGKPLSLNEVRIICHISEDLRFSDELIDYLLQYCVDRGKKDFRYINKVAEKWARDGITTPAQAEAGREDPAEAGKKPEKRTRKPAKSSRTSNSFNQFEQNSYDFDALEEELLGTTK